MEPAGPPTGPDAVEIRTASLGLVLAGLAIAVTGVSYIMYMVFPHQWLVWVVGLAFVAVGLLTAAWPLGLGRPGAMPDGKLRQYLIVSIPLAFVVSSQVCGLGFSACNATCHIANLVLIALAILTAVRLHRGQSVGALLAPMIVVGLIPHCVCHAPIDVLWHRAFLGFAPTCEMVPLAATLFSVAALRGVRPRSGSVLVGVLFAVMVFIIAGGLLFGFPWQGCVDHPGPTG